MGLATGRLVVLLALATPVLAQAAEELPAALAHLDELVTRRDQPGGAAELDAELMAALKAHPGEFEVLWRIARWKSWLADGGTYEKYMGKALKLDPGLGRGMPLVAMGRYYGALPWP